MDFVKATNLYCLVQSHQIQTLPRTGALVFAKHGHCEHRTWPTAETPREARQCYDIGRDVRMALHKRNRLVRLFIHIRTDTKLTVARSRSSDSSESDFVIVCGGIIYSVHRTVVWRRSYFASRFMTGMIENREGVLRVEEDVLE
jgi:hypothetical protein